MLAALPVLYSCSMLAPYRRRRLLAFLDPWADPLGEGSRSSSRSSPSAPAASSARGLMDSMQKLFYLPEPHTDFIYAVIGEELGLIGTTVC